MPAAAGRAGQPIPAPTSRPRPTGRSGSWVSSGHQVSTLAFNLTSGPMPRVTRSFDRGLAGASLTGGLFSLTSEKLDPHVLTYWCWRCAKRAATDFLDRREKRRHRVPLHAHSPARAPERGAHVGDPVWPTSETLDRCSRIGVGGAATDFLDRREKRRHRVPLRAHSRRGRRSAVR